MSIEVRELSKAFDTEILAGVSLVAAPGSVCAVVGRSGCGKSTLLDVVAGLSTPSSGSVRLMGPVGYVTQDALLLPWRTVLENVLLPLELRNSISSLQLEYARVLLKELDIGHAEEKFPDELSGGMRQRAALARALVQDAPNILLDEPFSALDFDIRFRLAGKLRHWIRAKNKSAIFVTHQIDEALAVSDRIVVLGSRPGRVIFEADFHIPEEERHPVGIRERDDARELFREVYRCLQSQGGE